MFITEPRAASSVFVLVAALLHKGATHRGLAFNSFFLENHRIQVFATASGPAKSSGRQTTLHERSASVFVRRIERYCGPIMVQQDRHILHSPDLCCARDARMDFFSVESHWSFTAPRTWDM